MLPNLLLLPPHTLLNATTRVNNNQLLQEDNPTIDHIADPFIVNMVVGGQNGTQDIWDMT